MISIIIPTFNEEDTIAPLIRYLYTQAGECIIEQILVIDGGSSDHTRERARSAGAEVLVAPDKGRAVQMNYGVRHATGEVVYFVHADTRPPNGFGQLITKAIANDNKAGCFTSVFDWDHPFLRFCNFFSRLPFWFCRGGGQTLFVKKKIFEKNSGFDESMQLMEEYDFIARIRKIVGFHIIKADAITSARDYRINGAVRLQAIYAYIFLLYALGTSQEKLLKIVKRHVIKG